MRNKGTYENPRRMDEIEDANFCHEIIELNFVYDGNNRNCRIVTGEWVLVPNKWFDDHPFSRAQEKRIRQIFAEIVEGIAK